MASTELRAAAQQALEALQNCANGEDDVLLTRDALAALRAALAKPVQEPVAQRGAMFHTHPAVERQRSVEAAVRPACGVDPAAKAQPVQEPKPVAWRFEARHIDSAWAAAVTLKHPGPEGVYMRNVTPLYAASPQRKPLSEEEIHALRLSIPATTQWLDALVLYTRAVERAHGIGGEG